jgi:catechol 2,3-dioxygenase-like lactoylglutathione lyase family enzyme
MFERPQVNFYARDVEASARFYRDSFGFAESFRTPRQGPPEHIELRLGSLTLGLASYDALHEVHGVTLTPGPRTAELVVWTDDVDRACADLAARGVPVLSPPHDFLDALRSAWVADPDGGPVQIVMRRTGADG